MKRNIAALALILVLGTVSWAFADHNSPYADISQDNLQAAIQSHQVTLLDCNGTPSYEKGHLPGAVDFAANKSNLAAVLPADKGALIVSYCGGPKCQLYKDGAAAAVQLGYTNVKHYAGGLKGWVAAKQSLECAQDGTGKSGNGHCDKK